MNWKNKDEIKQYMKQYWQEHLEELKLKQKIYRENNQDNIKIVEAE